MKDIMDFEIECEAKQRAIGLEEKHQQNLEEKHQQIAETAASLFIEKGFHKTSVRDIASAMGMSLGNLYYYINSKDDLLHLVYREVYRILEAPDLEVDKALDPAEKLHLMMKGKLKIMKRHRKLFQMTFLESKNIGKSTLKKIMSKESNLIMAFVNTIKDGVDQGVFKKVNPMIIGNFIFFSIFFYPLRKWFFKGGFSFEEIEKEIVDFISESLLMKQE